MRLSTDYVLFAVALVLLGTYAFIMAPSHRDDVYDERAYVAGLDGLHQRAGRGSSRKALGGDGLTTQAFRRHISGSVRDELSAVDRLARMLAQLRSRLEGQDDLTYVPWGRPSEALEAARRAVSSAGQPRIPRIIHQVYGLYGDAPPEGMKPSIASFKSMNPNHTHILWNATDIQVFVESYFPAVAPAFRRLRMPVLQADIARYLLLYIFGGVYSDIDTECLKPIDTWAGNAWNATNVTLIIGVEADGKDIPEWNKSYGRQLQFCQWTFAAAPQHAMLGLVIHRITQKLAVIDVENVPMDQVTHTTGPTVWTDSVYDYIKLQGHDWTEYLGMQSAQRVGDLLLLTITGFSPSVGHMGAKSKSDPDAMVMHYFDGAWTGRPRPNRTAVSEADQKKWDKSLLLLDDDVYY